MKTFVNTWNLAVVCLLSLSLSGCFLLGPSEDSPVIERSEMRVTAFTGGKKLANPEKELVHRLDLPPAELDRCLQLFSDADAWMKEESDANGNSAGVRIIGSRAMSFGLQRGDLLMSVNQARISKVDDVSGFCPSLLSTKSANMSVVRNSETHEIYLSVK